MNAPYDPITAATPGTGLDHAPSYWTATVQDIPPDDGAVPLRVDTEMAIIGGGYTGLSCAYHLAKDFGVKPMVLEANRPGWGGSGRNGGFARAAIGRYNPEKMIALWGRAVAKRVFTEGLAALDTVRELIRAGNIDCDALASGHLKIAHRASRVGMLRRDADLVQREFGYPAEFLDAEKVRSEHIGGNQSYGALRFPDAIALHPLKLLLGVLRLARSAGAIVHSSNPVLNWSKRGHEHLLTTPQGTIRAKKVVLATDAYTPEHLHSCVRGALLPALSHIIVTRPMTVQEKAASSFHTDHVLTDTRNLLYYWRRLPDDRILFGGRGQITDTPAGRAAQREFLLSELKAKLPALKDITVEYDWSGWVCLSADFMPHVYHVRDDPSVHYALAYMGSGVSYALHAGRLLAQSIASGHVASPVPPTAMPLPRFPFAAFRRLGQRAMYAYYRYCDNTD